VLSITSVSSPSEAPVDGGCEASGTGADDEQVGLLPWRELAADPQRTRNLARRGSAELDAARQSHQRQAPFVEPRDQCRRRGIVRSRGVAPGERQSIAAREVEHPHGRCGRVRADDLQPDALHALQRFPSGDERREHEVAEQAVLEQERSQRIAIDGYVTQGPRCDRRDKHRLPGQDVQLAEEVRRSVPGDLVAGGIDDCDLTIEDHDERVTLVTDAIQHIAGVRRALLPERSEPRQLGRGQHWALGRWYLCH
jgi:hypothetical protein